MYCFRIALLVLAASPAFAGDVVLGLGIDRDTEESTVLSGLADFAIGESSWFTVGAAHSSTEATFGDSLDTLYGSIGIDHHFDPFGIRLSIAYWGDSDLLDSSDIRPAVYFRTDSGEITLNVERRDFEFRLPARDLLPERSVPFTADGFGISARVDVADDVDLYGVFMGYDYDIDLRLDPNRDVVRLLPFTRLSVISTLLDERASAGIGFNRGASRFEVEVGRYEGAGLGSVSKTIALRLLTPVSRSTDVELGFTWDDNETLGGVGIFSVFVYFYRGD